MPLPFILGAAALTAAGYGVKKGYDGYQDKSRAETITNDATLRYTEAKSKFEHRSQDVMELLDELGTLQLKIGSDFGEFRKIAEDLLESLKHSAHYKDLKISIPTNRLNAIKNLELSAVTYLSQVVGAGIGGAAAAYAVYGGVMALAAASTGTPIAALSGVTAYNATLAAIGGGSLAAGGFGMAGGAAILGSVVAAPILAIAGWAYASHAEKALEHAEKTREQAADAIEKIKLSEKQLRKMEYYITRIQCCTKNIYTTFNEYFDELKRMNTFIETGGDITQIEDKIIQIIQNGYMVAAILTDIITTPLFKPKTDKHGKVILGENQAAEIELDENGMQVLNSEAIDTALTKAENDAEPYRIAA